MGKQSTGANGINQINANAAINWRASLPALNGRKRSFSKSGKTSHCSKKFRKYRQTDRASQHAKLDVALPDSVGHMHEVIESLPKNSSPRKWLPLACVELMRLMREHIELVEGIKELGRGYDKHSLTLATSPVTLRSLKTSTKSRLSGGGQCKPHTSMAGDRMDFRKPKSSTTVFCRQQDNLRQGLKVSCN